MPALIKAFKIRLYPTKEQEALMWRHVGACRFIWNHFLNLQEERYKAGEKFMSAFDMSYLLPPLKKQEEFQWLSGIAAQTLECELADLADAYKDFFKKKARHPKYKSRAKSRAAFPTARVIYFENGKVTIGKIGKVKYKTDFDLPQGKGHKFSNPRVANVCGKWMLSFGMECEAPDAQLIPGKSIGIDLGIKELAVAASDGEQTVIPNINRTEEVRRLERNLRFHQRSVSRKYEAAKKRTGRYEKSENILREEEKIRRIHHRLDCIRQNHLHQATHKFVSMSPERIVMEDLNVTGMMKNRHLSKAIGQQGFAEFRRQIAYKSDWNGIETVYADRFYPSSKTCSVCGHIKPDLKLSDRTYVCAECGAVLDRDYNAAVNLEKYTPAT